MNDLLTVENLTIHIQNKNQTVTPVKDLSFQLYNGQTLAILGESGSGKSLTALSIMQLLPLNCFYEKNSGIFFESKNLLSLPEINLQKIRGKEISMIFQEPMTSLNPVMRVSDQLKEVLKLHTKLPPKQYTSEIERVLTAVQIKHPKRVANAYPHELSGGMRQRVMIAMSLAGNPKILIADEPTTALDVITQFEILKLLKQLQKEFGMSLLFITHDLKVAEKMADEMLIMHQGKIVERGKTSIIVNSPTEAYTRHLFSVAPKAMKQPVPSDAEVLLSVKDLSVFFPIKKGIFKRTVEVVSAVENVSFDVLTGETLGLVGESGSGKTTLAKTILSLIKPNQGTVYLSNVPISKLPERKLRQKRNEFQIIFQDPFSAMDPRMRVVDILEEGMLALNIGSDAEERRDRIELLLKEVGLNPGSQLRYPHQFSGGERQRLCIARALSVSPSLIICDEPTSSLDASVGADILDLLLRLQDEFELAYLFITHNMSILRKIAHRVMVMHQGRIVESGSTEEVLNHPQHAYTKKLLDHMLSEVNVSKSQSELSIN